MRSPGPGARLAGAMVACLLVQTAAAGAQVLVEEGSAMRYLANSGPPPGFTGIGWTADGFDDAAWPAGIHGVGYEEGSGAQDLITTAVPSQTASVYTRTTFNLTDPNMVQTLFLSADWDDGYAAWINGHEVYRSPQIPAGDPEWDTPATLHESSNGPAPDYGVPVEITAAALPHLRAGDNLLAVGVWNGALPSSDLVLVPRLEMNLLPAVTRGPYLQKGTDTGMVVRWRTGSATDSMVRFGFSPGSLTESVLDEAEVLEHEIEIAGLTPDTTYYYSVGTSNGPLAGGEADHSFRTAPVPGTRQPLRVWVLGDSGTADQNARNVRDAYLGLLPAVPTDLLLMLGDNAYSIGTDDQYQAAVFETYPSVLRQTVVWPTFGNHDAGSASSLTGTGPYYDVFTLPVDGAAGGVPSGTEAYYSFDHANVHFICLNSQDVDRVGGELDPNGLMLAWLEQDVMSTSQDWVVAFWHHPPYSKGSHDSDSEGRLIDMRVKALPILEDWGVDLVLAGHSHSYERSVLLDGHYGDSSSLVGTMILDGGDGDPGGDGAYQKATSGTAPHEGAVYVVAGSSGRTSNGSLDHPVMVVSLKELGSMVLDVEGDRLTGRFLDDAGLIRDSFTIVKDTAEPPQADFTANPRAGVAPFDVAFEDLSSTNTAAWSWDLDGDSVPDSTEPSPSVQYAAAGTYDVSLTAINDNTSDVELRSGYICAASSAPPVVTDVIWLVDGDRLEWPNIPGAASYDVVRGDLGVLASSAGDFSAAVTSCLADDTTVSFMPEDGDPAPAEGYFYLVRSAGECDLQGTYDQALSPPAAPRDQGVAASGFDCP